MLESQKEIFESYNARVITVNIDEMPPPRVVQITKGLIGQKGFTFPFLLNKTEEKDFKIGETYLVKATPVSYLIDKEGSIVFSHTGALSPTELKEALEKLQ